MMGYNNKIGRVNLRDGKIEYEGIREGILKNSLAERVLVIISYIRKYLQAQSR